MKKFIFLWGLCFLALGMQFLVAQEDNSEVKKAVQLLKNNQIEEATKIFLRHQENSQALYYLGRIYSEKLILAERKKSFEFYKKSKEKNHVLAQTQYALYFLTDEFVKKDLDQAVRLLKEVANQDKEAQLILDSLYFGNYIAKKQLEKIPIRAVYEKQLKEQVEKNEKCFKTYSIQLKGNTFFKKEKFRNLVLRYLFRCIEKQDIKLFQSRIKAAYSSKGQSLVRTSFSINQPTKEIIIQIVETKIRTLKIEDGKGRNKSRKFTAFYFIKEKESFLDLDDIGQGLAQLQRLRSSSGAKSQITEPDASGFSDINILLNRQNFFYVDIGLSPLKDSPHGDYSYSLNLTEENLWGLNESFSLSCNGVEKVNFALSCFGKGKAEEDVYTHSYSGNLSIPFGFWNFSYSHSGSAYSQEQLTGIQEFISRGDSKSQSLALQKVVYRKKHNKISTKLSISTNENRVFIDDTLVDVSSRNSATARLSLIGAFVVGRGGLQSTLSYAEGLALFGADEDAPDIIDDEFHNQYSLWSSNTSYSINFLKNFPISYNTRFFAQATDRESVSITIGGSGSVRGYSSNSYSDDIGGYFKNTFSSYLFQKLSFLGSFANAFNFSLFYDYGCVESIFGAKNHRCLSGGGASLNFAWKAFSVFYSYEVPISSSKPFTTEKSIVRRMSASLGFAF